MNQKRLLHALLIVVAIGASAVMLLLHYIKIPTGGDQQEASDIVKSLEARYQFRVMSSHDPGPAVYEYPHPDYSVVLVFGNYTATERAEILAVTQTVRREAATKPIHLYFYPRELDQTGLLQKEILP